MTRKRLMLCLMFLSMVLQISSCGDTKKNDVNTEELFVDGYYVYPEVDLLSPSIIIAKSRIPQKTLAIMSDEQLAQAVADFPLLLDVLLSSTIPPDVSFFVEESDAYKELVARENGKEALLAKVKEIESATDSEEIDIIVEALKILIRYEPSWEESLTQEDIIYLEKHTK